jgi:hypothetical protein
MSTLADVYETSCVEHSYPCVQKDLISVTGYTEKVSILILRNRTLFLILSLLLSKKKRTNFESRSGTLSLVKRSALQYFLRAGNMDERYIFRPTKTSLLALPDTTFQQLRLKQRS